MKVLELQLPEQTASKLQGAAERLSVSPEQLSILSGNACSRLAMSGLLC